MSDKNHTLIKVENVSKTFILPHEKNNSVKSAILNFYKKKRSFEKQQVLDDISFEIKEGEFFGIVGRNGSGKSTLLKLLAGIYSPSAGNIHVNGRLMPFIELGVGFNPELTGRENVFLNGALLGFSRKEIHRMYDDIVTFAELEKFMDQKLKNYSSGMQVRLAFSIAIKAKGDILLLDEVLAVGDAAFQQKCFNYFATLKEEKKTVIFISHDMDAVIKYCTRAALIHDSRILAIDTPGAISEKYTNEVVLGNINETKDQSKLNKIIKSVSVSESDPIQRGSKASIKLEYSSKKPKKAIITVTILKNGQYLAGVNTNDIGPVNINNKLDSLTLELDTSSLSKGDYRIGYSVFSVDEDDFLEGRIDGPIIEISDKLQPKNLEGSIHIDGKWRQ